MNDDYMSAIAFVRQEYCMVLQGDMHLASDRPVRLLNSTPLFSVSQATTMLQQMSPQVVIVDAQVAGYSSCEVLGLRRSTKFAFLLVGLAQPGTTDYEDMMGGNQFDLVYPLPLTPAVLAKFQTEACAKYPQIQDGWGTGAWDAATPEALRAVMSDVGAWQRQAIAVWSPKGGVGKTTVAAELAATLAAIGGRNVALVDVNMNGGHIRYRLNVNSDHSFLTAAIGYWGLVVDPEHKNAQGEQQFAKTLHNYMTPVSGAPNLHVLPGIHNMVHARHEAIATQKGMIFARWLVETLKKTYDFVVVDMGSSINVGAHAGALSAADSIVVVGTPDLTGLVDIKQWVKTAQEETQLDRTRMHLVVNMWQESAGLPLSEATKYSTLTAICAIPIDQTGGVTRSGNEGISYVARNMKSNDEQTIQTVAGFVTLASNYYPPVGKAWAARSKGLSAGNGNKKKSLFAFGKKQ